MVNNRLMITLPPEVIRQLEKLSDEKGLSKSALILQALLNTYHFEIY